MRRGCIVTPLELVHSRRHDLPPRWDGLAVTWGEWHETRSSVRFHIPLDQQACIACGLLDEPLVAVGTIHPTPGEMVETTRARRLPSGRTYDRRVRVPARPHLRLLAFRCLGCRADRVFDEHSHELWDLDESDYTDAGSTVEGVLW